MNQFGKVLLAAENWTIPQKEQHGTTALSNINVILENCLSEWSCKFFAFSDSEIVLSWVIYEKTKLTTFVRNRVINIRSKMGLDILHHVEGTQNPTDVGTRPELITADSVRPGSVWLTGKDWMRLSMSKAQEIGVVKTVEDIKLTNDKKKIFKEGIAYDTFSDVDQGFFAIAKVYAIYDDKIVKRQKFSNYIYPPLKRSFTALVRITALVLLAHAKLMKPVIKLRIRKGEQSKQALKALDFPPARFKVFNSQIGRIETGDSEIRDTNTGKLLNYF